MKSIIVCQNKELKCKSEISNFLKGYAEVEILNCEENNKELLEYIEKNKSEKESIIFLPSDLDSDSEISSKLKNTQLQHNAVWVVAEDSFNISDEVILSSIDLQDFYNDTIMKSILTCLEPKRTLGIKSFLEKKSTIYSTAIFDINEVSKIIEKSIILAARLNLGKSIDILSTLNSSLFEAFQIQNKKIDKKIDIQFGHDKYHTCFSIKFFHSYENFSNLKNKIYYQRGGSLSQWFLAKEYSDVFEIRAIQSQNIIEVIAIFSNVKSNSARRKPILLKLVPELTLEDGKETSEYNFKSFSTVNQNNQQEEDKLVFKNKFSERIQKIKISSTTETIEDEKQLVKSDKSSKKTENKKQLIKNEGSNGDKESKEIEYESTKSEKSLQYLEQKIIGLEEVLQQREELIQKLNKEIEENIDPLKREAIGGVIDNQKEALKQNIELLEKRIQDMEKKEEELIVLANKSVEQRDEFKKRAKAAETQAEKLLSGNNSKITLLEKKLEESKRHKQELTKKVQELTKKTG